MNVPRIRQHQAGVRVFQPIISQSSACLNSEVVSVELAGPSVEGRIAWTAAGLDTDSGNVVTSAYSRLEEIGDTFGHGTWIAMAVSRYAVPKGLLALKKGSS
jgi:hypothetical protein